jgi:rhodanese-related sulfurtransferase
MSEKSASPVEGSGPGRLLSGAFAILGVALACAAVSNALAGPERRLEWLRRAPAAARAKPQGNSGAAPSASPAGRFAPHPDRPWVALSAAEAEELFRTGTVFLDARRSTDYRAGHVAGARSLPVWEADLEGKIERFAAEEPDRGKTLVVYCGGGECEDSHTLAEKLYLAGYDAVLVYTDGFPDWQRRGLPVKQGDQP